MKRNSLLPLAFPMILLMMVFMAGNARADYKLLEIRNWSAPDHTRVVMDLDGPPAYEVSPMVDPLVLTVNLKKVVLAKGRQEISVNDRVIRKIRVELRERPNAQVTLFLVKPARWNVFVLKPYEDKPDRLVIDVSRPDLEEKEKAERRVGQELKSKKTRILVIDPGHGGDDPGAIGPRRTMEKDIVLAMAKKLQKSLDETGEIRAFLTRRGDYFVSLDDRIKIAQEYGADLFVSVHTNGSKKGRARGTSIYCLSLKGASDKATELLAQKENASDMVGGTLLPPVQKDLNSILLDLEMTHTINESLQLGGLALNELSRINYIQFSRPRQASFSVLKAPGLPSILVEAAYITNPDEEKYLRQDRFQWEFSGALVTAVKKFMPLLTVKEEGAGVGKPKGKVPGPGG